MSTPGPSLWPGGCPTLAASPAESNSLAFIFGNRRRFGIGCRRPRESSLASFPGTTRPGEGPSGRGDEAGFVGHDDELGPVTGAELGEDPAHGRLSRRT